MEKLIAGAQRLGVHLTQTHLAQFELYYRELLAWNKQINLTSIVDRDEVQTRHFLDCLTVFLAFDEGVGARVLDVGTGAGFPGLPLRIVYPHLQVTLLESTMKKVRFLKHLVGRLEMADVEVVCQRAETLAHSSEHRERFDLVLARALAPMASLAELTLPFCRVGGVLVAQKKGDISQEMARASVAIASMGGQLRECKPVSIGDPGEGRLLAIVDKVAPTPAGYPRRPGVPRKRPLV